MAHNLSRHSDSALYEALRDGDARAERAFEELYDRYAPQVFRYCRRVLGSESLAEDMTQETFVRLYRSAARERAMTNVAGYVLRIARNLCLNAKSSKYYGLASLPEPDLPSPAGAQYEHRELIEIIRSTVECLPVDYREAFVLREYNGLSYAEIADILDIPETTVKIRIHRAKQKLRTLLSPYIADMSL